MANQNPITVIFKERPDGETEVFRVSGFPFGTHDKGKLVGIAGFGPARFSGSSMVGNTLVEVHFTLIK